VTHKGYSVEAAYLRACGQRKITAKTDEREALRKHSPHEKTAASVLLKPFISSNV